MHGKMTFSSASHGTTLPLHSKFASYAYALYVHCVKGKYIPKALKRMKECFSKPNNCSLNQLTNHEWIILLWSEAAKCYITLELSIVDIQLGSNNSVQNIPCLCHSRLLSIAVDYISPHEWHSSQPVQPPSEQSVSERHLVWTLLIHEARRGK